MGVRGLTTYINHNHEIFLHQYFLQDSNLVIDGHSLCAQLYRNLNCFSAFGGDYDKFASYVKNFFKALRKCNITPYILFDGSYEKRKLRTAHSRLRSKIYGASKLDPVTQGSLQIFPLLLRNVFKEVLRELNVQFTVCEFEADDEIAAMARHLDCPVLSYDSDFFIYNVQYIPFNTLETKPKPVDVDGARTYALECRIYKVKHLIDHFGGMNEEMLPLLATLLGNDFVEKKVFNKFFSQLKMPKSKTKKNEQQRCIDALFKWLQNETFESAVSKILGRLKKNKKDKVFAIIKKSVAGYNRTQCQSLKYFNMSAEGSTKEISLEMFDNDNDGSSDDEDDSSDNSSSEEIEIDDNDDNQELSLPDWLSAGIRNENIPKIYINLYTHHLYFCSPQAEDYSDQDSFLCALPILRFAFDLLTDFSYDYCTYVSRENCSNYKRVQVNQTYAIPRLLDIPFSELSIEESKEYFKYFLKQKLPLLDLNIIDQLPSNFQICMIAIIWWISNCKVNLAYVHSLFISYLMLEVIDEKTGTFRGHNHFNNKYSSKLEEIKKRPVTAIDDELFLNKNKVQYEDCLLAASVLLKHFEIDTSIMKRPKSYDAKKMHAFAEFQCCLMQFNSLNIQCRQPIESTKISKMFNGTFVYNIALKLENQLDPVKFFEQYLKGATSVLSFYYSLCKVYGKCAEVMSLSTNSFSGKKRSRRRRKGCNTDVDDEINFIVKGFESEVRI